MAPRDNTSKASCSSPSIPLSASSGTVLPSSNHLEGATRNQAQHHLDLSNDDISNIMATPTVNGLARNNKRRGGRRISFWACSLVLVVVIVILIEDEVELRRTDSRVMNTSWKGLEKFKNNHGTNGAPNSDKESSGTATSRNSDSLTMEKGPMDDDMFAYWFGTKSERSDSEKSWNDPSGKKSTKNKKRIKARTKKKLQPFPVIQYDDDNMFDDLI